MNLLIHLSVCVRISYITNAVLNAKDIAVSKIKTQALQAQGCLSGKTKQDKQAKSVCG